jgi:hypothetical protein
MSLNQKFKEALSGLSMSVSALRLYERYRLMQAKRIETRHGTLVLLTLLEEDDRVFPLCSCPKVTAMLWRTATFKTLILDVYNII